MLMQFFTFRRHFMIFRHSIQATQPVFNCNLSNKLLENEHF